MTLRNQGQTTLAQIAQDYFKTPQEFATWMSVPRKEFGKSSGYAFLEQNPSIGIAAIAGQIALSTGGKLILENSV